MSSTAPIKITFRLDDVSRVNEIIPIVGNYLKVIRASSGLANALISFNSPMTANSSFVLKRGAEFRTDIESIVLQFQNQPGEWLEIIVSDGDTTVDYPEDIGLTVDAINSPVKTQGGGNQGQNTMVNVGTTLVKLLDARPTRTSLVLYNQSTSQSVAYGYSNALTTANGVRVGPQGYATEDFTGEIWAISYGSSANISISETWR